MAPVGRLGGVLARLRVRDSLGLFEGFDRFFESGQLEVSLTAFWVGRTTTGKNS